MYQLDVVCFEAPFRFTLASMREFGFAPGAFTVMAEDEAGRLAGFVVLQMSVDEGAVEAYVVTLDVDPAFRRTGVASALMDACERVSAREGIGRMVLHVWTENVGAIRFYEARGFVRLQLDTDFYEEGFSAFGYEKRLG